MCGICGIVGTPTEAKLQHMLARIAHRGPDGNGTWIKDSIGFGHARLAIIDTSDAGRQPMHHAAGIHSVVNGEIYNYPDLRRDLEAKGAQFTSHCDSEVVLHGYLVEGADFFKKLNGMFAIALYDERDGTILLIRDRAGIKPLYYAFKNGTLAFASEIKALLAAFDAKTWDIDPLGLSQYLAYQTPLKDRTLFAGVHLLEPGHILTLNANTLKPTQSQSLWEPQAREMRINFSTAAAAFQNIFNNSVARHLLSDVPVSSYVSAGFDSASVAVTAAQISKQPLTGFTGRFKGEAGWYDETKTAGEAVQSYGGKHICADIDENDLVQNLDAIIDALDEPRMGMGAFSQYMVAKRVAKDFKVILTGHGGDELFSGYPVFKISNLLKTKPSELPHLVYFALSWLKGLFMPEYGRHMPVLWDLAAQKKIFGRKLGARPWQDLQSIQAPHKKTVDQIYHTYLRAYLPGLLVVEDKISMAHALESRTPMLDNAMIDFSLSIPQAVKLNNGTLKAIIKENARTLLPESFFTQPKRGFPTPLRRWLRGPLHEFARNRLLGPQSRLPRLFDANALRAYVDGYDTSLKRFIRPLDEIQSHRMWQLLSLEAWLRIWEDKYGITLRLP